MAVSVTERTMIWNGVGFATDGAVTAAEAIERAGLDWKVELRDAGYRVRGGVFKASSQGTKAIVKLGQDGEVETDFGYVGRRFVTIQNDEVFDWCDKLVDDYGAKYESAWALYGGKTVGLTMRFPDTVEVGGEDPYAKYLLVRTSHDGTGSMRAAVSMVRLACTNMVDATLRQAKKQIRIAHLSNATQKLAAARETLEITFKYQDEFQREMEKMIQRTIDEDNAKAVIKAVLGAGKFGGLDEKVGSILTLRGDSGTIPEEYRSSRYGLFQAFTEWADWERRAKTPQSHVVDLLDGRVHRAKEQMFAALATA